MGFAMLGLALYMLMPFGVWLWIPATLFLLIGIMSPTPRY